LASWSVFTNHGDSTARPGLSGLWPGRNHVHALAVFPESSATVPGVRVNQPTRTARSPLRYLGGVLGVALVSRCHAQAPGGGAERPGEPTSKDGTVTLTEPRWRLSRCHRLPLP